MGDCRQSNVRWFDVVIISDGHTPSLSTPINHPSRKGNASFQWKWRTMKNHVSRWETVIGGLKWSQVLKNAVICSYWFYYSLLSLCIFSNLPSCLQNTVLIKHNYIKYPPFSLPSITLFLSSLLSLNPTPSPPNSPGCKNIICQNQCLHGLRKDSKGCRICACNSNPCNVR